MGSLNRGVHCRPKAAENATWFWEDVIIGPARCWENVPWIAFRHTMSRDELKANNFEDWAEHPA
jgi:hypothetical protein